MSIRTFRQFCRIALVATMGLPLYAADHFVGVDDSGFLPAQLTIDVGDTVTWINTDDFFSHTTTSDAQFPDPNAWHGLLIETEDTFTKTFSNPGVFSYRDQIDIGRGTITVVGGGGNEPEITLESPRLSEGQFLFEATGLTIGKENVLESTTNLVDWTAVSTNLNFDVTMTFTNDVSAGARFFRVYQLP
jgi:plastocyanin